MTDGLSFAKGSPGLKDGEVIKDYDINYGKYGLIKVSSYETP
jgi:hypothetical protein